MFSALKKFTRNSDERCPAPVPMSSSLQKKFSRGVHYNMKILIKGDRNVGKSCLLQRLQGGPFIEDYVPTDQIQVAPIHWTYKNTDHIVKVEVWEVVDKGKTKKKFPIGLKLENQSTPSLEEGYETPILDATFLDVYKNASGVILVLDITKPWTFEYVVKELSSIPADIPVVVLGNHCDMQHHRQVHPHHIEQALHQAKLTRTAPVRYAESSMRNGFGLRLLHKFLSVPFLRLQRTSLLEQLQRNQKDMEEIERELDDFQMSEESHYNLFVDRMANKRKTSAVLESRTGVISERSPSIVLGAGKPIVPHDVNPLVSQLINPLGAIPPVPSGGTEQTHYVNTELLNSRHSVGVEPTQPRLTPKDSLKLPHNDASSAAQATGGVLEEFYAGTLDSSFLEDLAPLSANQDVACETDSEDDNPTNPKVTVYEDDLDIEYPQEAKNSASMADSGLSSLQVPMGEMSLSHESEGDGTTSVSESAHDLHDYPLWAGDSSVRRSPEGGEDPDIVLKETEEKVEKKHKKKKSKDKDKGDGADGTERKEKKHKRKKSKGDKSAPNPQLQLLTPSIDTYSYEDYDSL